MCRYKSALFIRFTSLLCIMVGMKNIFNSLILCCAVLTGCGFNSNNFSKFEEKLGVTMPNKYERVFHSYETTIDSNLQYDIYKIKNDWKLDYQIQFQTDFEEELDLEKYVDAINQYKPLNIPEKHYIPSASSLDWVCKREKGTSRNYEWLLIFDKETKTLYALDSTHQWIHQAIPMNN